MDKQIEAFILEGKKRRRETQEIGPDDEKHLEGLDYATIINVLHKIHEGGGTVMVEAIFCDMDSCNIMYYADGVRSSKSIEDIKTYLRNVNRKLD